MGVCKHDETKMEKKTKKRRVYVRFICLKCGHRSGWQYSPSLTAYREEQEVDRSV